MFHTIENNLQILRDILCKSMRQEDLHIILYTKTVINFKVSKLSAAILRKTSDYDMYAILCKE